MENPMLLFSDCRTDPTAVYYDFDLLTTFEEKREFVEKLFGRDRIFTDELFRESCRNYLICCLHNSKEERQKFFVESAFGHEHILALIIQAGKYNVHNAATKQMFLGLTGKMTFRQLIRYFLKFCMTDFLLGKNDKSHGVV